MDSTWKRAVIGFRAMNSNPYLPSLAILLALAACGGGEEIVPDTASQAQAPSTDPASPIGPISSREASAPMEAR